MLRSHPIYCTTTFLSWGKYTGSQLWWLSRALIASHHPEWVRISLTVLGKEIEYRETIKEVEEGLVIIWNKVSNKIGRFILLFTFLKTNGAGQSHKSHKIQYFKTPARRCQKQNSTQGWNRKVEATKNQTQRSDIVNSTNEWYLWTALMNSARQQYIVNSTDKQYPNTT